LKNNIRFVDTEITLFQMDGLSLEQGDKALIEEK